MELGRETETSSISTAMSLDQPFVGMEKDMELLLSMPRAVLAEILEQLDPNEYVPGSKGVDYLVRQIYKFVERRKSLVVIDDIWKNDGWEIMREAFPINCNVFLITRSESVGSEECDHLYKLGVMTEDEGWELLKRIALPQDFG
ncbi:probable disease resistance protein At1g59620 [Salvia splendens]|uniref:probable disease resistance protein At1g59620 n=1 Tax=Salvia splendens TaxID=180675 RepID=UPI001C26D00B|nr:probable disease resistance protein At1g59620 [Salvia splendens]